MQPHFSLQNVLTEKQISELDSMEDLCGHWRGKEYNSHGFNVDFGKMNEYGGSIVYKYKGKLPATLSHETYEKYIGDVELQKIYDMISETVEKFTGKMYATMGTYNTCTKAMDPHVDIINAHKDFKKTPMYSIIIPLPSSAENGSTLVWDATGTAPIKDHVQYLVNPKKHQREKVYSGKRISPNKWGQPTRYMHNIGDVICFKRNYIHAGGPITNGLKRFIIMLTRSQY